MDTKNWKEFRVGDLFDVETSPSFDMVNINILNKMNDDYKYEFIIRSKENNGVKGYVEYLGIEPNEKNKITISQVGTIVAQYRTNDYYTSQNVFNLSPKFDLTENKALFFANSLNCMLRKYFGYSDYPTLKSLKNEILLLPAKNDKPDFEYMEEYIEEIKLKYVDKLEKDNNENIDKALRVTGLSYADLNKDLTVKLADRYEEFRVGDLFNGISGDTDIKQHHINDKGLPVITSGLSNNGLLGLSDVKAKVISQNTITVDMFGNAFYRNYNYKMVTHARVFALKPKFHITDNIGLYFATMLFYLSKKFDYSNMCSYEKIKNDIIVLPAIDENTPDFDYMEKAIYIYILQRRLNLKNYLTKRK